MKRRFRFGGEALARLMGQDAQTEEKLTFGAATDIGKVRSANQDALVLAEGIFGVADGMGGHQGGEVASAEARDTLLAALSGKTPALEDLREAIRAANTAVHTRASQDEHLSGMGTTLTVLWAGEKEMFIGHVGDSRCYLLRGGELKQKTEDHSLVAELQRAGMITREEAENHPMRNVITRAVGTDPAVEVDGMALPRRKGDRWVLCSDGLHGMVSDREMAAILRKETDPQAAADRLLKAALDAGGRDNITIVVVSDGEGAA